MDDPSHKWNISFQPIIWGFVLSLTLVLSSYFIVVQELVTGWSLVVTISLLAVAQAILQIFLFLHIGLESKPRWKLMIFLFLVLVIVILVGGSMWIMQNLNYNLMPSMTQQERKYE